MKKIVFLVSFISSSFTFAFQANDTSSQHYEEKLKAINIEINSLESTLPSLNSDEKSKSSEKIEVLNKNKSDIQNKIEFYKKREHSLIMHIDANERDNE